MIGNVIKAILTVVVIIVGGIFLWFICTFSYNSEAYYELRPTAIQQTILGISLGMKIPDDCNIERMTCTLMAFDDDDPTTFTIYSNYTRDDWNKVFNGRLDSSIKGSSYDYDWTVDLSCDSKNNLILYGRYQDVMVATDYLMYKDEVITKEKVWHRMNCIRTIPLLAILILIWLPYDRICHIHPFHTSG